MASIEKTNVNQRKEIAMERGIYKRGDVYWIRYAGLDKKMIRESSHSTKMKDADLLLTARRNTVKIEKKQPIVVQIPDTTFNELADRYCEWMLGRHKSADSKRYRIDTMRGIFGGTLLRNFTAQTIEQYQTDLMNKGLQPASVNKNVSILKAMLRKAVDWNRAHEDILKQTGRVRHLEENNIRLRYLCKEECSTLVKACDIHLRPIVVTALNTGCRRGEILSLKWDNVDMKHGFILLDNKTKTGKRREIPINATLRDVLQSITRRLDVTYVFFDTATGKPYQGVDRSFNTACRKAGIRDFHFHDLRHTFASLLVMNGVDIQTVAKLLGHSNLTMTLRYAHLAPSHLVKAVDILDETLTGTSTAQKQHIFTKKEVAVNG